MHRHINSLLLIAVVTIACGAALSQTSADFLANASAPRERDHSREVEVLLRRMTLKEKIGQMTQLELGMIADGKNADLKIDRAKLDKAVNQYGVGSILNVYEEAYPPERWREIVGEIQDAARRTRLRIPVVYGIDSIHGANYVLGSTLFPQPIGMAATWNPTLVQKAARITAAETRAAGLPWTFSPILDVVRTPLWPRVYETFGEDPYLASILGVATIRGFEGDDPAQSSQVAACLKHYVGYSDPLSGRDRSPALIPETTLREYLLPPFAAAIRAGAHSVMVNSGAVNDIPTHANRYLLTTVLRGELGFKGLVVSDWEDIKKLVSVHHVAASEKKATKTAIMAGIDMSMVPSDYSFSDLLLELVNEGSVPMWRIDEAVRRVLAFKYALGLFDEAPSPSPAEVGDSASRQVALEAARESITLLKNDRSVLPIAAGARVFVVGPTADSLVPLNNGWTYTWQGGQQALYPHDRPSIRAALAGKSGANYLGYALGVGFDGTDRIRESVDAARSADVIVLCLGEDAYAETPGNLQDLTLPEPQLRLAEQMAQLGKPVVLVLIEGRPRLISRIADRMSAIVLAYNPGNEGGQAIADVLFGDINPSGKLPLTYPRHPNELLTYDHKCFEESDQAFGLSAFTPQFPFGFGLSYTKFRYSDLRLSATVLQPGSPLQVSIRVTNTGAREGAEVVQLYLHDVVASLTPPCRRLKRFAKVNLQPEESKTVIFTLSNADFAFVGHDNKPVVEPGDFELQIGGLRASFSIQPAH